MKRTLVLTICALAFSTAAQAKPKINEKAGVRTLASAEDRSILARGSVFEIAGAELGPGEAAYASIPYPQDLSGVYVRLTLTADPAVSTTAYLISVSAGRIVAVLPSAAAAGDYRVTVTLNGETSDPFQVRVADRNFGLLTNTGGFAGMAQARVLAEGADSAPVTLAAAVFPGATIEIDATGLGPIDAADNELPSEANLAPGALLLIGPHEVPVTYLGRNPARPGYDRLVVTLPLENLPAGCAATFRVKLAETISQTASIPILGPDQSACTHPLGISPDNLSVLADGGTIVRGGFTLVRLTGLTSAAGMTFESKIDQFSGGFVRYTAAEVAQMVAGSLVAGAYDANRCVVHDAFEGNTGGVYVDAGEHVRLAGPAWSVTAPRGTATTGGLNVYGLTLDSRFNGVPLPIQPQPPGLLIQPGRHTLTGPGGAVVGPFSVDLDVSSQFQWTNIAAVTEIDTSRDLTFLYSGGGADDIITANGLVKGPAPEAPAKLVTRIWVCLAKGSDGRLVVPASLLQRLPRVSAAELSNPATGRYSSMSLASYNPAGTGEFKAPLTEGGITEIVPFIFSYVYSKAPVPVR
jgi:uncharacterized protein (TIGR03437 family)